MDADVYHILDRLHYLSYFLGLARYDRFRDKNGTYKYTIGKKNCFFRAGKSRNIKKNKTCRATFCFTANVILMIIGSYLAIVEITRDEISDFDVVTLIYMFTEPTITGIIIIDNFTRKQKQFLQSAELLHEVDEEFFKLGLKRTIPVVKWMITYYLNAIVFGNFAYNVLSYVGGKTMIHSIYEYLSYGISFHAQNTIICYYNTFTTIIIQDLMAINEHIETIGRPVGDVKRMEHELKSLGKMHFSLCESLKKINDACATTIFMYSMRAFIEICAWLLSLNGLLPKLKVDFTMMIVCYVMTMLCIAVSNQMMKNWVRFC